MKYRILIEQDEDGTFIAECYHSQAAFPERVNDFGTPHKEENEKYGSL